ncbi:hypothetical protein GCM10027174_45810 [Salinifilum aidingensis]
MSWFGRLTDRAEDALTSAMTCPACGHNDETYLSAMDCSCTRSDCACSAQN